MVDISTQHNARPYPSPSRQSQQEVGLPQRSKQQQNFLLDTHRHAHAHPSVDPTGMPQCSQNVYRFPRNPFSIHSQIAEQASPCLLLRPDSPAPWMRKNRKRKKSRLFGLVQRFPCRARAKQEKRRRCAFPTKVNSALLCPSSRLDRPRERGSLSARASIFLLHLGFLDCFVG